MRYLLFCVLVFFISLRSSLQAGEAPEPVRVCTLLENLTAYDSKVVAVVGRFSFRPTGRTLSEEKCGEHPGGTLRILFDKAGAPPTPERLELDGAAVRKLLKIVQEQTSLAKFKFGTADYDRWAVIYGRMETDKADRGTARLVCAGESVVMFLIDRQ